MGVPGDKDAKRFYRAAGQRLEDARRLMEAERARGAVYLAGYCVECMLKALILSRVSAGQKGEVLESFAGSKAHNYDWLRFEYRRLGGDEPSKEILEAFLIVKMWGTELRYDPGTMRADDAEEFLSAVDRISDWADGRL